MQPPVPADAKAALRRQIRGTRAAISDRPERSVLLAAEVVSACDRRFDTGNPLVVLAYRGVGSEPDTADLVDLLAARTYDVLLPRVEVGELVAVRHVPGGAEVIGAFGIPEPVGPPVDPATIDVVIVPGLAFTLDGRRLGQGGGFYDRFLTLVRPDCVTIGMAFREQVVDDLPTEAHDRKLDLVVFDPVPE